MEAFEYLDAYSTSRAGIAARHGDVESLASLISSGAPLDVGDNRGFLPLHEASENGHLNCVEMLLNDENVKHSINRQTFEGETSVFLATENGHSEILELLLHSGASNNIVNYEVIAPISIAAQKNRVYCLKVLVENGANLNQGDCEQWTPLHEAAKAGHIECLNVLLAYESILVNVQNDLGLTPVAAAAMGGNVRCCRSLAEKGADLEKGTIYGDTPLILAAQHGFVDTVKFLLEHGVTTNCSESFRLTALHYACYNGDTDVAELLLKNKGFININARAGEEKDYATPLHFACSEGNVDCVKLLLKHGAYLDVRAQKQYETPLMAVTSSLADVDTDVNKNNLIEICSLLLKSGANALAETIEDGSVIRTNVVENAIEMHSTELLRLLTEENYLNIKSTYFLKGIKKFLFIYAIECLSVKAFDYIFEKIRSDSDYICNVLDSIVDSMVVYWFIREKEDNDNFMGSFKKILAHFTTFHEIYKRLENRKLKVSLDGLLIFLNYDVINERSWTYFSPYGNRDGYEELGKRIAAPSSLQKYCRGYIRRLLGYNRLDQISMLALPTDLKKYLNFEPCNNDDS